MTQLSDKFHPLFITVQHDPISHKALIKYSYITHKWLTAHNLLSTAKQIRKSSTVIKGGQHTLKRCAHICVSWLLTAECRSLPRTAERQSSRVEGRESGKANSTNPRHTSFSFRLKGTNSDILNGTVVKNAPATKNQTSILEW